MPALILLALVAINGAGCAGEPTLVRNFTLVLVALEVGNPLDQC